MQFKKNKTVLAAIMAAAMACSAIVPTAASAAGTRTKAEAYGEETYAARFMSLYDDVITNGVENGYMSPTSTVSGGLGVPYHSVETLCIEAPDYGHETTSEALSYLVWAAAMRDNIVNKASNGEIEVKGTKDASTESVGDLAKAWLTMEATMIPDTQGNIMKTPQLSATYSDEWEQIEFYPTDMVQGNNAVNPIHSQFCNAYGSDNGLYLMHWLADVDDWYGFGAANGSQGKQSKVGGSFVLINTFQRGEQESCWETIPHACVDMHNKGYGLSGNGGMKGFFNTEDGPAEQWSYTNAPDAEDRAIQAVYAANRWGVGDQSVQSKWGGSQKLNVLVGKMGDELRNNMFDKYYKEIGTTQGKWAQGGMNGQHFLRNWYTSWGGGLTADWAWQIGASHMHEFYQNPLAAYALLANDEMKNAMKTSNNAISDYTKSLQRQMELYLWLLADDGMIAGGCTNSWNGRYEPEGGKQLPDGTTSKSANGVSKFYDMYYLEHPVYADPGSNHWIGNQVWAVQRLAELYYVIKTEGDSVGVQVGGMSMEAALETILDKWTGWFLDNTILGKATETTKFSAKYESYHDTETEFEVPVLSSVVDDDKSFAIPSSLIWEGQPNDWTGSYTENKNLKSVIVGYGDSDLGCVSSLANSLIHYAAARGITADDLADGETSYNSERGTKTTDMQARAKQSLYLAKELLDREWETFRDDIGLGVSDHNTNLPRLWETKLVLPDGTMKNGDGNVLSKSRYTGKMPNGDTVENGVAFVDIRSNYKNDPMYKAAEAEYQATGNTENYYFTLHRFWHAGDIMMTLGYMAELYPDLTPGDDQSETLKVTPDDIEVAVGETETLKPNVDNCTFESADSSIATVAPDGTVTGVAEGTTTITVTSPDGQTTTVTVTVTATSQTTTTTNTTTTSDESGTTTTGNNPDSLIGDVNLDGKVDLLDAISLNKYLAGLLDLNDQAMLNANCDQSDGTPTVADEDASALMQYVIQIIKNLPVVK